MYSTWTPKSKLFSTHERTATTLESVAARREHYADKIQHEIEEYEENNTNLLPSVIEAKRQNALFKQREMERLQHELNDINSRLRVERDHYQQWARSPIRRSHNTILYRGIQQLKARAVKDDSEKSDDKRVSFYHGDYEKEEIDQHADQMYQTQNVSQYQHVSQSQNLSHPQSCVLRRQRTADSGFSRFSSYGRSPLKVPNAVVHVLSEGAKDGDGSQNYERKIGSSRSLEQGVIKPRYTKHRERFPLSVNTPKCFEDHALVVHQPVRSSDPIRQKSRLDLKELDTKHDKHDYRLKSLDSRHEIGNETNAQTHKGSYFGNFAPRKLLATIRLAELYDFSAGSNHSHSAELRYLERQFTDPNLLMRGSKVVKWVPNLQRTREKN